MIDLAKVPPELFAPILAGNLREVAPSRKLVGHFLEAARLRLAADACWLTHGGQGERLLPGGRLLCGDPLLCDETLAGRFLRHEHPPIPAGVVLSSLLVHGRQVAVVCAARRQGEMEPWARRALDRLCGVLAEELARREEERLTRVLDRIREKVVSELRPRDLAYQILDGLHQLVDYDHSSAFLAYDRERGVFRVEAEKIVWTKAKSPFVGREIRVSPERIARICRAIEIRAIAGAGTGGGDGVAGGHGGQGGHGGDGGHAGHGGHREDGVADLPVEDLAGELLDYQREAGMPPVTSLLAAPLFFGDEFLGILKMAAWQRPPFVRRDLEVVERFLPAAAVSMRNARVNKSLEMQAVEAEVKASLVTLSHAVAHDVNNAVGSILPLAQQMRFELRHGPLERDTLDRDLGVIIDNARLCQRIFSNMLRVAGSGRGSEGPVDVAQVVAETMPFLLALAGRRGVEIALDLAPDLPPVRFRRQDLQHVVLNLVRNSLEAYAPGGPGGPGGAGPRGEPVERGERAERSGRVEIAAWRGEGGVVDLSVVDDGPGIPAPLLSKVQEPFFSTRPGGTGLGLAICRALAWQNGATLGIESPLRTPSRPVLAVATAGGPELPPEPAAWDREGAGAGGNRGTKVTLRLESEPPGEAW
ncbi:MAG TPA: HAMP domain-containing sensor histidine kinase [Thermoanaerobaculia bacterium]|nr:HAMP domain-containing sensor histidine kinase [Thermoanaerobaculia bacterium]